MADSVRYRVEKRADPWHLTSGDTGESIFRTDDRDALVSLAEAIVKDVGGEFIVQRHVNSTEAVIRHPAIAPPDSPPEAHARSRHPTRIQARPPGQCVARSRNLRRQRARPQQSPATKCPIERARNPVYFVFDLPSRHRKAGGMRKRLRCFENCSPLAPLPNEKSARRGCRYRRYCPIVDSHFTQIPAFAVVARRGQNLLSR